MKEKNKCKKFATLAVPWASKIINGCDYHALGLVRLGAVMGGDIQAKRLPENSTKCEFVAEPEESKKIK